MAIFSLLALGGCQSGSNPFARQPAAGDTASSDAATTETATASRSVRLVDRDVEAPQVFQITDTALWDGRPSLGGVWVASPDAVDPERVILRNPGNGKFVIGALFRRERDNPGPKLQISSDAAAALGLLAGQPGTLNVTALRREEAPDAAPDARKPLLDAAETVQTAAAEPTADPIADPIASAEAAIDATEADAATPPATDPAPQIASAEPAVEPAPKKRGFWRRKAKPAADAGVPEAATGAVPADAIVATALPGAPTVAPATPPAAARDTGGTAGAIQIGIFAVEDNADRTVATMRGAGITAESRRGEANGKAFWSVVARADSDRAAVLGKIKGLGFTDAYILKR